MSKLIAIWGSPYSGKTTLTVKLSSLLAVQTKKTVTAVLMDLTTPTLPLIFPETKNTKLYSLGAPLSQVNITQKDTLKSIMTSKNIPNLGFLGFKNMENKYTYPTFGIEKYDSLFCILKEISDYIVADCTSIDSAFVQSALATADQVIRMTTPDLQSALYFNSQLPMYEEPKFHLDGHKACICMTRDMPYPPVQEMEHQVGKICFSLPFCRSIQEQMQTGELLQKASEKKYQSELNKIAEFIAG